MKTIKGRILEGEQTLVIFDKHANPKIKKSDAINVCSRSFSVLRVETNQGVVAAEVEEADKREVDYSFFPGRNGDRYCLHVDLADVR